MAAAHRKLGPGPAAIVREWETYTVEMKRREMARSIEAVVIVPRSTLLLGFRGSHLLSG